MLPSALVDPPAFKGWGKLSFPNALILPHAAGFRRAPAQIKGLKKAIWSCYEGGWMGACPRGL